ISDMAALIDHLSGVEGLNLTLDVCEQRSTSYHQAIGFNLFVPGHSRQVGAGGRYMTKGAMASGATLYLDGLLPILGGLDEKSRKLLVPLSTSDKQLEAYQAEGWTTVFSTNPTAATAQQTDCSHYLCETTQTIKEV
ncbi:MAG: ATP phosphoribosyltransferase regulatory subunit, partial [Alphaproteobacteria bacterium]